MKLRGIDFGNVLAASGVQGFFGEGYWFHRPWKRLGLDFSGVTFVSKTATILPRQGNMALNDRHEPKYPFPHCVRVRPFRGNMLNAAGLSNPGLGTLLDAGKWQERTDPFFISVAPLSQMWDDPAKEMESIAEVLLSHNDKFKAKFGLQVNLSCPNAEHDQAEFIRQANRILSAADIAGVPIMAKFSIITPIETVLRLVENDTCDAICVSNTIPFGWGGVDWERSWGSKESPLAYLGGGGLSGRSLRPLVCAWIRCLRDAGFKKPINGGGGILKAYDVVRYHKAGASAVFIGSVATLRPWRVRSIVAQANRLSWS